MAPPADVESGATKPRNKLMNFFNRSPAAEAPAPEIDEKAAAIEAERKAEEEKKAAAERKAKQKKKTRQCYCRMCCCIIILLIVGVGLVLGLLQATGVYRIEDAIKGNAGKPKIESDV